MELVLNLKFIYFSVLWLCFQSKLFPPAICYHVGAKCHWSRYNFIYLNTTSISSFYWLFVFFFPPFFFLLSTLYLSGGGVDCHQQRDVSSALFSLWLPLLQCDQLYWNIPAWCAYSQSEWKYMVVFLFSRVIHLALASLKKNTGAGEVNHEKLLLKLHQFHIYVLVSLCIPAILWHIAADSDGAAAGAGNSYFSHCGALCHLQKSASHGSSRVWWQHSDPDALLWGMPGKHTHMCKSCSCLYHYLQQQTFTDEYSIKVYHM